MQNYIPILLYKLNAWLVVLNSFFMLVLQGSYIKICCSRKEIVVSESFLHHSCWMNKWFNIKLFLHKSNHAEEKLIELPLRFSVCMVLYRQRATTIWYSSYIFWKTVNKKFDIQYISLLDTNCPAIFFL